jgi:protein tyrosine phosphatase (PTP) superfamily phosphohydrolase (DUF442 family)
MTDQRLSEILNWRVRDARLTTSGQPSEAQLADLRNAGVVRIVNLGPHTNKGALKDEPGTVAGLGMEYTYIPVDFDAPTLANFDAFCQAIEADNRRTHVHCIYNARVSAFFYRYAAEGRGGDAAEAFAQMDGIWRPGGVWADFIDKPENASQPNRYLGYEY